MTAAKQNFLRLLERSLREIKYSWIVLDKLPEFDAHRHQRSSSNPYSNPTNLRRFELGDEGRFFMFHPMEPDGETLRHKLMFLVIVDLLVDKKELHNTFSDVAELNCFYDLIEQCEIAINRLRKYWNAIPQGNPDKPPDWDIHAPGGEDAQLEMRQINLKHLKKAIGQILKIVHYINQTYGYSLRFKSDMDDPDIQVAHRYLDD